ncbi:hypothetical protein EMPG_09262 [Blastomyces silverae]|uniref:Uncharacterized protein n=1 Tax=Blastomyces silverae TaxID=2060906 RepID=A0A0H1B6C9_9EURO|nr:hypothetical protein EMPG_09262 [Blastomyces silverae]
MSDLTVEVITYFNLLDILTLLSNMSVIYNSAAFIKMSDSQLVTQALISKRSLDIKEEAISSSSFYCHCSVKFS